MYIIQQSVYHLAIEFFFFAGENCCGEMSWRGLSIDFVKGVNVSEILNQLILENIYKSDYKNVTEKLLEENLTYETVIQALKEIYENGIFSN